MTKRPVSGNVVPFGRRGGREATAPPAVSSLSKPTRRAAPEAQALAAEQNAADRAAYTEAAIKQGNDELIAGGKVVPARITMAMNLGGHEGPEVDIACGTWEGNPAGDVDGWELGETAPTADQVKLMAELTGFGEAWFYLPIKPGPLVGDGDGGIIWMCGPRGCTLVKSDWVDERGVLHYGNDPDDERQPRTVVQGSLPISGGELAKTAPARKKTAVPRKKAAVAVEQMTLPNRMPEHLRAALEAKGVLGRRDPGC